MISSSIDVVKNSDVSFGELEIKWYVKDTETFIDKTNNVKNIEKVNIPKADNDPETKVDPRIVLESVQKTVHASASFAPRDRPQPHGLFVYVKIKQKPWNNRFKCS